MTLRLGTRGSQLALAQAHMVAGALRAHGAEVEIVIIRTSGDHLAQVALADFGGKALFVKEIEEALLAGRVDLGVHSLKDMPVALPPGLGLPAFLPREDPADLLIARDGGTLEALPAGAVVGTSSLRRRVLLASRRPDLQVEPIRGNVDTRLRKLREGQYDALVMARAGLRRLGIEPAGAQPLPVDEFVPAVGQGIVGVEAPDAGREALALLARLDHTDTRVAALTERAFLARLGAGCHTPVAGLARVDGEVVRMRGLVATLDGGTVLLASASGAVDAAEAVGREVADELLARGAGRILEESEKR
jgi:hydroxymethylbilane synthase